MAEPPSAGLPKLQAVARAAGVSVSTVSKVLNGRPDVGPATRTRVAELLGRAGYHEVGGRRVGAGKAGNLVEAVVNRLDDVVATQLLRAVCLEADARGIGVIVTDAESASGRAGRRPPRRWLQAMDVRGTGAVISLLMEFSGAQLAYFEAHQVAACTIDMDERDLGGVAVRHLLDLGHVRIAVEAGPDRARLVEGCREALVAAGADGPECTQPSAVVFADGHVVRPGCAAIEARGLRVPDDVSVVCCGLPDPPDLPITAVVPPFEEMARAALDVVSGRYGYQGPRSIAVPPVLVERGSTAPPRTPGALEGGATRTRNQ